MMKISGVILSSNTGNYEINTDDEFLTVRDITDNTSILIGVEDVEDFVTLLSDFVLKDICTTSQEGETDE